MARDDSPAGATRAPATRDQADAYRFGLRRLEAALVRGDPVPLHEQIRSQRRASGAGVALGALGVAACVIYGLIAPAPDWRNQAIVVGAGSGALYVVSHEPDRLVPVANLPAARMVLAALAAGRSTTADPATAAPVTVPDEELDTVARTPTAAVPGAVAVRPDATVAPQWAVCDSADRDGRLTGTTVVGGAVPVAPDTGAAALLDGPDDTLWLVTSGHRHRIDAAALRAFGMSADAARAASAELLSAVPEGPELVSPQIEGRGDRVTGLLDTDAHVGDVYPLDTIDAPRTYHVAFADGLQQVPAPLARLVLAGGGHLQPALGPDALRLDTARHLVTQGWPAALPQPRTAADAPVLCWRWTAGGDPDGAVSLEPALPVPGGVAPVELAQHDGGGPAVDAVAVGSGGAVRVTAPGRAPGAGPIWVVGATGVAYGVADAATAKALGIGTGVGAVQDAPDRALRLLPAGPTLDVAQAGKAVDVLVPAAPTGSN